MRGEKMAECIHQNSQRSFYLTPLLLTVGPLLTWVGQAQSQTLRIYHIDVEQADATLFISPNGNTLLVDSGKNGHGSRIKAVLQQAGVNQIYHFVVTHYHEDHYGGIDDLVNDPEITIGEAYDRGDKQFLSASKRAQQTYVDYQNAVGDEATQLTRGETIPLDPTMSVTCISSGGVVLGDAPNVPGTHENDLSISLLVQYRGFRYFIGGDIELTTEGKIEERDLALDVDVYQANHHGSHTSSSWLFLQDLQPTVVVISSGNDGRYKHPRQHTLNNFAGLQPPSTVFQINKYLKGGVGGNTADEFIADLESSDTDGTILITVDPSSNRYTVTYRDTLSHSFDIKGTDAATATVVIESLLPDPTDGRDREREAVTLRNDGSGEVTFGGWYLQDRSGRIWSLGTLDDLPSGQSVTIRRLGMAMSLNNDRDEIVLVDSEDGERDRFPYTGSSPGVTIQTGH